MSLTRVAAVTGANKGIGLAIVRNLCLSYPSSALSRPPPNPNFSTNTTNTTTSTSTTTQPLHLTIYLTSRSSARGTSALTALHSDPTIRDAGVLTRDGGPITIQLKELDVVDEGSVRGFAEWMEKEHGEGVDVLVNNAGIALEGVDSEKTRQTLQTNYHAPLHLTNLLLPLLRRRLQKNPPSTTSTTTPRIVTLGSLVGKLSPSKFSPLLIDRFLNATSVAEITSLMDTYQTSIDNNTWQADGWPASAYVVSKAGIIGAMGVLGREELKRRGDGVLVNSCCPGYVITDMTKQRGRKTPDQGARTPVKLALGDTGGVGGEFWEHEEVSRWA